MLLSANTKKAFTGHPAFIASHAQIFLKLVTKQIAVERLKTPLLQALCFVLFIPATHTLSLLVDYRVAKLTNLNSLLV